MKQLNNKAQALVEYILIIAIVAMLIIGLVKTFGGYLKDNMMKTTCSVSGLEYIKGDKPGQAKCGDPIEENENEEDLVEFE